MATRGISALSGSYPTFTTSGVDETGRAATSERKPGLEPLGAEAAPRFEDVLGNLVVDASAATQDAARKADLLARGASDDLHGTMIAAKEAEISVKLVGSIRNKLIDAFQELWRTNV